MSFQQATYRPSKNSDFAGNPFIESLPARLSQSEFWEATEHEIYVPDNLSELDAETLEHKAGNIMKSVSPTPEYYDVYCDFLNTLKEGYQERNPAHADTVRWQNQVATSTFRATRTTAPSLKFTGFSGMGKTTLINSVLTLIPPVIEHPKDGPLKREMLQFVYLKIDIPSDATSMEICLMIAAEIDKVKGTNYRTQYERLTRSLCINRVITLCTSLLIGIIIFDEIHNICFAAPNERKHIFTLFDQLTQVAKVPTVKIGTSKANRLAEKEFTNARRLGVPHEWKNYSKTDESWKLLLEYAWNYQLLPRFVSLTPSIENRIYTITQGIPHCLFFLIEQANKHCIRKEIDQFSEDVLNFIFDTKFSLMRTALIALRHNKLDAFDDLMTVNLQLDKEVKKMIKNLLKIADENRFTAEEAKAAYLAIEKHLPEYQLTQKEQLIVKRLEKEAAADSKMATDQHGYPEVPV